MKPPSRTISRKFAECIDAREPKQAIPQFIPQFCGIAEEALIYGKIGLSRHRQNGERDSPGRRNSGSRVKPKPRQGKVFLVNASQIFEKGNPKNFIPEAGIQRIADTESYRPVGEIVAEIERSRTHAAVLLQAVLKEAFAPTQ